MKRINDIKFWLFLLLSSMLVGSLVYFISDFEYKLLDKYFVEINTSFIYDNIR